MKRLVYAASAIVLLGLLAGCGGDRAQALPELDTTYDVVRDSQMVQIGSDIQGNPEYILEDYHEISGIVHNPTQRVAYAVSVVVTVQSPDGEGLHEETIELGDIGPDEELPFGYRWYSEDDANLDARASASEPPAEGD